MRAYDTQANTWCSAICTFVVPTLAARQILLVIGNATDSMTPRSVAVSCLFTVLC